MSRQRQSKFCGEKKLLMERKSLLIYVNTNFVSLQLNENLYNKLQYFDFFKDMDSISGCSSQRTSSDSSLREL